MCQHDLPRGLPVTPQGGHGGRLLQVVLGAELVGPDPRPC